MTNSQVLQLIIEELSISELTWDGDKELFELLCAPITYGNDTYQQRKHAKQLILDIFSNSDFQTKKFNSLADNIICGENRERYAKELLDFLNEQLSLLSITTDTNMNKLVKNIPCKSEDEKNYKNSFNNWKNGNTERINCRKIKQRLEQNFDFPPSLWNKGEIFIKTTIKDGVVKFVKQQTVEISELDDMFNDLRKEFNVKTTITQNEIKELEKIKHITQTEVMKFIAKQYPLSENCSQEFIQKMIPIFYAKGYYELLLQDVITALDMHLQESNQIKKIKAHILGSPVVGEYKKAFDILSTIKSDEDTEIVDMRTEAISNMRRHQLSYPQLNKQQKKEIITKLISHYENIFQLNNTYHYYPAINLAYMIAIAYLANEDQQKCTKEINQIYEKTKHTIQKEKNSEDKRDWYFANITELEFMLLKGKGSPIAELERFLEMEGENISLTDLGRTQRQMQFFVDTIMNLYGNDIQIIDKIQNAIEVIDDYIEYS